MGNERRNAGAGDPAAVIDTNAALRAAAHGDAAAMMAVFDRLGGPMYSVALRILGSPSEAQDAVQDTFVKAWRELDTFDPARGTASAWLLTLTRNRAIDVSRARARRRRYEAQAFAEPVSTARANPEGAASHQEAAFRIRRAVSKLTESQRELIDLAYYGGLSHSQIAERLAMPLGTVKTRIFGAVRALRAELQVLTIGAGRE